MTTTTRTNCDCRYTANVAEVSRSYSHYSGYVAQWETAASVSGTYRQKVQAADEIGLNLQNLPNLDRPTAIGLAEVLLRHLANMTGLVDYYGCDLAEEDDNATPDAGTYEMRADSTLPVVDTECADCGGDGVIPATGPTGHRHLRGTYVLCPACTDH